MSSNTKPRVGVLLSRVRVEEKLLLAELESRGVETKVIDDRELVLAVEHRPELGVVRNEARRDSKPFRRDIGARRRSPVVEGPLVDGVRLREAKRRVQRERELEENERRVLRLPALLEQREQGAVVLDGLVDRVLLARLVSRT